MGKHNDALRKANSSIRDLVSPVGQEVIDVVSKASPTESLATTHATRYPLNGLNKLNLYVACTGANIVATDTLTFKFYIRQVINDVDTHLEIDQIANYEVTTTGVTAGDIERYEVDDTDDIIKNATHYSVVTAAGIAMPATCYGVLIVGKYNNAGTDVNIEGITLVDGNLPVLEGAYEISSVPAAAAVTAASSAVTLTKAEILNDGVHTIFYRDNGGAADVNDTPLYPGERIGPLTGTIRVICAAAETSTLRITEFV